MNTISKILQAGAFVLMLISCRAADIGTGPLADPYPIPTLGVEGQPSIYPHPSASQTVPVLKPADSQELVSGICGEATGDIVEILLTPDGPASPRCVKVTPNQRLKFINGRDVPVQLVFGPFSETISPGGETLLDKKTGEYLAPGIHYVEGAEIMLLESAAFPPPSGWLPTLIRYTNTELGYTLPYPADWSLYDHGMSQVTKDVKEISAGLGFE